MCFIHIYDTLTCTTHVHTPYIHIPPHTYMYLLHHTLVLHRSTWIQCLETHSYGTHIQSGQYTFIFRIPTGTPSPHLTTLGWLLPDSGVVLIREIRLLCPTLHQHSCYFASLGKQDPLSHLRHKAVNGHRLLSHICSHHRLAMIPALRYLQPLLCCSGAGGTSLSEGHALWSFTITLCPTLHSGLIHKGFSFPTNRACPLESPCLSFGACPLESTALCLSFAEVNSCCTGK